MNVLFLTANKCAIHVMEKLEKKINIDKFYVALYKGVKDDFFGSEISQKCKGIIDWGNACDAKYNNTILYHEAPPLDISIIKEMKPYQGEAIKLFERHIDDYYSIEKRFMDYYEHLKYWHYFLIKNDINIVVNIGMTPHESFNYIIYRLCQILNIPCLFFELFPFRNKTRIAIKTSFEDDGFNLLNLSNEIYDLNEAEIKLADDLEEEYRMFTGDPLKARFPVGIGKIHKQEILKRIKGRRLADNIKSLRNYIYTKYEYQESLKRMQKFKRGLNELLKYYSKMAVSPNLKKKYIYFPLQYQPEMTTCPLGGEYVHMYLAIEMLSYYVPDDVYIYVKEHPDIRDVLGTSREKIHYEKIASLRNVKLIDMDVNSLLLTQNSIAVASLTGSVGYEAMYLHKPYLMFGFQVMKYAPHTYYIRNNDECKKAINEIVQGNFCINDRKIRAFLKACERKTRILEVTGASRTWDDSTHNINILTEMIYNLMIQLDITN